MENAKRFSLFVLAVLCLVLSGCASTGTVSSRPDIPLGSPKADAAAKRFAPKPGTASVYVMREYTFLGRDTGYRISLDETDQGRLSPGTFFLFHVLPGKHEIGFKGKVDRGTEKIYAVEGGIYYIEIRPGSGIMTAPAKMFRIDQKRGRQLITEGKRARTHSDNGSTPLKK